MNILIMSLKGPTIIEGGGAGVVIHQLGKRWVKKGHKVKILCTNDKNLQPKELMDGIEIIRKGTLNIAIFYFIVEYCTNLRKWADIIIENETSFPLFVPVYVSNKKILTIVHGVKDRIFFQTQPFAKAVIGYILERAMPIFYRKIKFVAICDSTKKDLVKLGISAKNIKMIPNGVDNEEFIPGNKTEHPTIFYIGRLGDRKKIDDLFEAFMKYIAKKFPDSELLIAGFGDKEREKYIKELSEKNNNIKFLGFISEKEKICLFQRGWIFVFPTIMEGFPLTILEANACGTPVIGYNTLKGSIKDGINGLLVNEQTPKKLAEVCISLLENGIVRNELKKTSVEYARYYSWDNQSDNILRFMRQ